MLHLGRFHYIFRFISFIICLYCYSATCQTDLKFRHYTTDNGVSGYYINCIYQDSMGFIWIATDNGVDRYDGYTFVNYSDIFHKTLKIKQSVSIECINEGHEGNLFFGTTDGIIIYDVSHNSYELIDTNKLNPVYIKNNLVYSIHIDKEGIVWAGTWDGLDRLDFSSNICTNYQVDTENRYAFNAIKKIEEDKRNNLWIATRDGGVASFNKKNDKFTHYRNLEEDSFSIPSNRIKDLHIDEDDEIWVATWGAGLCRFESAENKFYSFNLNPCQQTILNINRIIHDTNGILWIATENGLIKYNKKTGGIHYIQENPAKPEGLSSNIIISAYADKQDGLWFGATNSGINYLSPYNNKFKVIPLPDIPQAVCQDSNRNYWYGTKKGIYILDINQKDVIQKYPDVMNNNIRNVSDIVNDRFNNIWISSNTELFQFTPYGKLIRKIDYQLAFNDNKKNRVIEDIVIDEKSDGVWLNLSEDGLAFYDLKNKGIKLYEKGGNMPISDNRISDILLDKNDNLWIATAHMLQYKSSSESLFLPSTPEKGDSKFISHEINSLYEGSDGEIWIGTTDCGLQKYNPETGQLVTFSDPQISKFINGIIEDDNKNIWATSAYGLICYNRMDNSLKTYSTRDGLPSNLFLLNKTYKTIDGDLAFLTKKGCFIVNPDTIPIDNHIPAIVLTGIWVNNKNISMYDGTDNSPVTLKKDINFIDELSLNYRQSDIAISFSALSFKNPSKNRYRYQLIGLHTHWIDLGENHQINFSNLSPGRYILQIIGSNSDGNWNLQGKKLKIIISPPWWKTLWFRICTIFLIIGFVVLFVRIRLARLKKQKIKLEKEVQERTLRISEQNEKLEIQTENLREINIQLKENQEEVLQQKEEIEGQAENLSEANKILKEINDTKDRLFSIIGHDLKNPFHAISGLAELLLKDYPTLSLEEQLKNVRMIKDSSDGAANLLENLLQWALIQTDYNPVVLKVSQIVEDCVKVYKANAKNKNINITFNKKNEDLVTADRNMITTIVRNMLNNAIKFTPKGGLITIKIFSDGSKVVTSVSDSGVGMDEEAVSIIFQANKKLSTKGTDGEKGTGLGLILCKEFAEKNNGMITVSSKQREGSIFSLVLPVETSDIYVAPVEVGIIENDIKESVSEISKRKNVEKQVNDQLILIIEDSPEIRNSIVQNIRKHYNIIEAENGKNGIETAFKAIPDLIICDIIMPVMDGYHVCDKLKNDERTSHIPVILLTAVTGDESKIEGYKTGADDYLNKPFPPDVLLARVNNLLESRKKLRERFARGKYYDASEQTGTTHDQLFLERAFDIVEKNMMNEEFNNDAFIKQMNMSRAQLYRKLRALTNQSVSDFIKTLRLKKAAFLIENTDKRINEIVYEVGFKFPSHFTKSFKDLFGILPSEYPRQKK